MICFYQTQNNDNRGEFLIMDTFVKSNFRDKLIFLSMDISSKLWIWCFY